MASFSSGMIGLSLLSGADAFSAMSAAAPTIETRAQRRAKAAFTTAEPATPPWKVATKTSESARLSAIRAMKTIVDKPATGGEPLDTDVQTTFTAYKALDRLQLLAATAAKDTTGTAERASLQKLFARGLTDLKTYLGGAPSDKVDLAFGRLARQAQSVSIAAPSSLSKMTIAGKGVVKERITPIDAMTGTEKFRIDLSATGISDSITVDLTGGPVPPTLDSVATAINRAIAAVPKRDAAGQILLDEAGQPVPRWAVKIEPSKTGDTWGLSVQRGGFETISIDQIGASDAIMVASGVTGTNAKGAATPTDTRISRFDDPAGTMTRQTLATLTSVDSEATDRLKVAADADSTGKTKAATVNASTRTRAMVTDAQGFSYVVGTSAGDMGGNLSDGDDDLLLTKLDSEGKTVWQRTLGAAGTAQGAAVTIAPDGGIVVAGDVTGTFDGAKSDGDMLVARFDARGEETFSTLVRAIGKDTASAVAVGPDGSIYVGGATDKIVPTTGSADAVVARFDATGKLQERRVIDSGGTDAVKALAIGADGELLALTAEGGKAIVRRLDSAGLATDLGRLDLGRADARAMAVAADGTIAVVGGTDAALDGAQVNGVGGARDGFVARIDAGLAGTSITYLASAGEDQADSVAFMDDAIYVGGRTGGALAGPKTGTTDAFVARIDAATGAVAGISQFGTSGVKAEPVQVSAVKGGNSVLGALGLSRGTLTPTDAVSLEAQTSLRVGDEFAITINGRRPRKITIAEGDTLTTLSNRLRKLLGTTVANVTTPSKGTGRSLRIDMKPGNEMTFIAGAAGKDALAKLGLDARRIASPAIVDDDAPKVQPGGSYALNLTESIRLDTKQDAAVALARIKEAVSFSQSAYRSLFWDETKALLADTAPSKGRKGGSTAIEKAQLANYQAALTRLSSSAPSTYGF